MKRSEMIEEMVLLLYAHAAKYPQYPLGNLKEAAELILRMQEDKGMLPPAITRTHHRTNAYGAYLSSITTTNQEWEPESNGSGEKE